MTASLDSQALALAESIRDLPRGGAVDAVAPVACADLAGLVIRARALLDDGDVAAARLLADVAYGQAATAASAAGKIKASAALVAKAHRLQGDALLIEAQARMRIADEWDNAEANGQISRGGRPAKNQEQGEGEKPVSVGNGFTAADTGLSRKQISEARQLRNAERKSPGIAERAIAARLAEGLAPTKANLRVAVGTASATKEERGFNLYETPVEAMRVLLALESFGNFVLEPACGRGAISGQLEAAGYEVALADVEDYGTIDRLGTCQAVVDFLTTKRSDFVLPGESLDVITNPPYGSCMNAFIAHALREFQPGKMALLLNLNAYCGFDDADRNFYFDEWPPSRIIVFSRRLPMMHRDGWDGPVASSRMNTAWFIWERVHGADDAGRYGSGPIISRVDWKDFEDRAPLAVLS